PAPRAATRKASSPHQPSRNDRELLRRREPRLPAKDVVAVRLDPVERCAVQLRERPDAERAASVERRKQLEPLREMSARPPRLKRHERAELRRRLEPVDAEPRQLVLREVDAPELPVLVDIADDVDELQRDAERLGMRSVVGAIDRQASET